MKEKLLDKQIEELLKPYPKLVDAYRWLANNEEIEALHEMTNLVLVTRLKYNDHGKVHARLTVLNALKILLTLGHATIPKEGWGTLEDSLFVVMVASFLHDIGNAINRSGHEYLSIILAKKFVEALTSKLYPPQKAKMLEAMIYECILCHMGRYEPTSIEAGIVATADGCDMEEGRARIPIRLGRKPDIHAYSALSIKKVEIKKGKKKPVRIEVLMKDYTGVFQIQAILLKKVEGTDFKDYVEIVAKVEESGEELEFS